LTAAAEQSHTDILDASRRRGLGFSGIPVGEQVRYDSTTFKPAVANLYANQNTRKLSLEESLNGLFRDQRNQASGILQSEQDREEQQRQFDATMAWQREQLDRQERAAKAASAGSYLGGGGAGPAPGAAPGAAQISRTEKGGFNFIDGAGRPITAAQYSKLTGVGFRSLLAQMAANGDPNAKVALQYVGDDGKFGSAPQNLAGALGAVGATGNFIRPGNSGSGGGW
jgi:hypothetical protein